MSEMLRRCHPIDRVEPFICRFLDEGVLLDEWLETPPESFGSSEGLIRYQTYNMLYLERDLKEIETALCEVFHDLRRREAEIIRYINRAQLVIDVYTVCKPALNHILPHETTDGLMAIVTEYKLKEKKLSNLKRCMELVSEWRIASRGVSLKEMNTVASLFSDRLSFIYFTYIDEDM